MRLRILCLIAAVAAGTASSGSHDVAVVRASAASQPAAGAFAAAPDQTLTDGGVTLRYRELGTGDAVLLIHGYGAALESQTRLANLFATTNRVVTKWGRRRR